MNNSKIELIILFALSFGLNEAEILALDYQDINFEAKTLTTSKLLYKGRVEKYRSKFKRRQFVIPQKFTYKNSKK